MMPLSLTARLTLLFALASTLVLAGLGLLILSTVRQHFIQQDEQYLDNKLQLIQSIIADVPLGQAGTRLTEALHNHPEFNAEVRLADGRVLYRSAGMPVRAREVVREAKNAVYADTTGREYRLRQIQARQPGTPTMQIIALIDTAPHTKFLRHFTGTLALYILASALMIGLLGWAAARQGLRPLHRMAARAREVTAERLDQRMPLVSAPQEIIELAAHLNAMLARLQVDFRRLSELSSDIAHELRTPITNVMTQTEVALTQPRSSEVYRDVLLSNAEELQRLARMISDMLYLARTEHDDSLPDAVPVQLAQEVEALFEFYDAIADASAVTLLVEGDGHVHGDRLMLRRALGNLLSNALRYAPRGSPITVLVGERSGAVEVAITNTGPAIPADALPHLFERFFRAERSRHRGCADGAGLGLAITRAIMLAHQGSIAVRSDPDATCFTLRFGPPRPGVSR